MTSPKMKIWIVAAAAIFAASAPAFAQHWGHERTPSDGACFYKDADFRGEYFCVGAGETLKSIPKGLNDEISSIRLFGRAMVTVYRDHLSGRSSRFERDVHNLKNEGWNDTVSSLSVERVHGGPGGGSRSGDVDRIVTRAYQDLLNREPDQQGLRQYRTRMIDDDWTEAQVRDSIRKSPEYIEKTTMTYPKAQEVVRRAYLSTLKREPDAGSRGFVDKVMRDHWTQADVERELRKSSEYRGRD